jgi:hypothetical protein
VSHDRHRRYRTEDPHHPALRTRKLHCTALHCTALHCTVWGEATVRQVCAFTLSLPLTHVLGWLFVYGYAYVYGDVYRYGHVYVYVYVYLYGYVYVYGYSIYIDMEYSSVKVPFSLIQLDLRMPLCLSRRQAVESAEDIYRYNSYHRIF